MSLAAAVIPYAAGGCAIVIADASTAPARVVHAESWPIGEVVPFDSPDPESRWNARREVTPSHAFQVARNIARLCETHGAESIAVESFAHGMNKRASGDGADRVRLVTDAIVQCVAVPVATVAASWRHRSPRWRIKNAVEAGFVGWPDSAPHYVCALAGGFWLHVNGSPMPKRSRSVNVLQKEVTHAPPAAKAVAVEVDGGEPNNAAATGDPLSVVPPRASAAERTVPLPFVATGAIVAGVDPGSKHVALVIAQGDTKPLHWLYGHTFRVGEMRPRAKPVQRADGSWDTHRHTVDLPMVQACAIEVVSTLTRYGVTRLCVEHDQSGFTSGKTDGARMAMTIQLKQALWVGAEIIARASIAGIEVTPVAAGTARGVVITRKRRGGAGKDAVRPTAREQFIGWPAHAGESDHQFDAAICALYLVRSDQVIREARVRKARDGSQRPTTRTNLTRAHAKSAARKAAIGCTCPVGHKGRHPRSCGSYIEHGTPEWFAVKEARERKKWAAAETKAREESTRAMLRGELR